MILSKMFTASPARLADSYTLPFLNRWTLIMPLKSYVSQDFQIEMNRLHGKDH